MSNEEILDADALALQLIEATVAAGSADGPAVLGLVDRAFHEVGPHLFVRILAAQAAAMANVAGAGNPEAFMTDYRSYATVNRMEFELDTTEDQD